MSDDKVRRMTIAKRLKSARELAGLSQNQVAKLLNLKRPAISEIEAGRRRVSAEELSKLGEIYDVSVAWLAGSSSEPTDLGQIKIELAARELSKLKEEDVERLFNLLQTLRIAQENEE